jgi:2,3-bisphosphoglycerate-dependent phosphoglycerate mutase
VTAALIRHAAYRQPDGVPSAHLPYPLSAEGEAQAREAGERLASELSGQGWQVDCIIDSSKILRAWQTAKVLSEVFMRRFPATYVVAEHEALAERSLGAAANLTIEQIEAVIAEDPRYQVPDQGWKRDNRYKLPFCGAESLEEAGARVARHVESRMNDLARDVRHDTVKLFVGHGGAFRLAAVKLGVLDPAATRDLSMHYCGAVLIERLGDGRWQHVGGEWKARPMGDHAID